MRPGLEEFSYSERENGLIDEALATARPWDCETVATIKKRIKEFHLQFGNKLCCYCYRDLQGEFAMVIDIEHILPKRHYRDLTFDIRNMSVACKRCNMKIKRDDLDFLNAPFTVADIEEAGKYKLVHPNIDTRDAHLARLVVQRNAKKLVKYMVISDSEKGKFAYDYFQLMEFEVDSYDTAQGANLTTDVESETVSKIRALVKDIE